MRTRIEMTGENHPKDCDLRKEITQETRAIEALLNRRFESLLG